MIEISDKEFEAIKEIMYEKTGVFLKPSKKQLVITRLRKRLEELQFQHFSDYVKIIKDNKNDELETFINALTTNETYFFRHTKQFNYFYSKLLPEIVSYKQSIGKKDIKIWTGACSTGEEPYSIAIACKEFFKDKFGWKIRIIASDINSRVIGVAKEGIYSDRSLKELSNNLINKYFKELTDNENKISKRYLLDDNIKANVEFKLHNLLNIFQEKDFDVIFLRNVMIYFDTQSKQKVVSNLETNLRDKGYFLISLSESLNEVKSNFKLIYSGIYQKETQQ